MSTDNIRPFPGLQPADEDVTPAFTVTLTLEIIDPDMFQSAARAKALAMGVDPVEDGLVNEFGDMSVETCVEFLLRPDDGEPWPGTILHEVDAEYDPRADL